MDKTREIQRFVRSRLPKEAFRPNPRWLWHLPAHIAVIVAGYWAMGKLPVWAAPLLGIIIGHSMACLVFLGHSVTHNAVIRGRGKRLAETVIWTFANVPAMTWKTSHNDVHHRETNTEKDFFRYFHKGEDTFAHRWMTLLFYPNRHLPWNPLVPLVFLIVLFSLGVAAMFLPARYKVPWVAQRFVVDWRGRVRLVSELSLIVLLHVGFALLVGDGLRSTLGVATAAYVATAFGVMYIFTQHSLKPLAPHHDPVPYTTSIYVWPIFDRLHHYMSHHVSHHIYESMDPNYYPMVEALVAEHFPDVYHRIPVWQALRECMELPLLKEPPVESGHAVDEDVHEDAAAIAI